MKITLTKVNSAQCHIVQNMTHFLKVPLSIIVRLILTESFIKDKAMKKIVLVFRFSYLTTKQRKIADFFMLRPILQLLKSSNDLNYFINYMS